MATQKIKVNKATTAALIFCLVLVLLVILSAFHSSYSFQSRAAGYQIGDVNHDGKVDLQDAAFINQLIATGQYNKDADLNHDGVIDQKDIQMWYNSYYSY